MQAAEAAQEVRAQVPAAETGEQEGKVNIWPNWPSANQRSSLPAV